MSTHAESIRAFRLYEKMSKNGNTYLTGRWGGAKVAVLKSREVADDGSAIWDVLLSPAPERAKPEVSNTTAHPSPPTNGLVPERGPSKLRDEIPF